MSTALQIAIVQTDLEWENPAVNKRMLGAKIDAIPNGVNLIILPEMFTSGFTMNPSAVAETMDGDTVSWLLKKAKQKQAAIMGSLVVLEDGNFYNRMVCAEPSGTITTYNKRHTFTLAGEHKIYKAGTKKVTFNYKGWKICPQICYDLRFPVWARNVEDYDVVIYVANWPKVRIDAWDTLLKARAIENMAYCVGVNRVGFDGNNHEYSGHSAVYDVLGNRMDTIVPDKESVQLISLDKEAIKKYRDKLNFLNDRDVFSLKV